MRTIPSSTIRPAMPSSSPSKSSSKRKGRDVNDRKNQEQFHGELSTDSTEVSHDQVDENEDVDMLPDEKNLEHGAKMDLTACNDDETESEDDMDFRSKKRRIQGSLLIQRKSGATKQQNTDGPSQPFFNFGEPDMVEVPPRKPLTSVRRSGAERSPEHPESDVFDFDDEDECVVVALRKNSSSSIAFPKAVAMPPSLPRKPPPLDPESKSDSKLSRVRAVPTLSDKRKSAELKKPPPDVVSIGRANAIGSSLSQSAALSITEGGHDSSKKLGISPSPQKNSHRKQQTFSLAKIREELNLSCPLDLLSEVPSNVEQQVPAEQYDGVGENPTYVFEDLPNSLALLADSSPSVAKEKAQRATFTTGVVTLDRAKTLPLKALPNKSADLTKPMKSTAAAVLQGEKKPTVVTKNFPHTDPAFFLPKTGEIKNIATPESVWVLPCNQTAHPSHQMQVMTGNAPSGAAPANTKSPNPTVSSYKLCNELDPISVVVLEETSTTSVAIKNATVSEPALAMTGVQRAAKTSLVPLVADTLISTQPVEKTTEVPAPAVEQMEPALQEDLLGVEKPMSLAAYKSSISGTQLKVAPAPLVESKAKVNVTAHSKPLNAAPNVQPAQQVSTSKPATFFAHKVPVAATDRQLRGATHVRLMPKEISPRLQPAMPNVILTAPSDMAPITGTLQCATNLAVPSGSDMGYKMAFLDADKPTDKGHFGQVDKSLSFPARKNALVKPYLKVQRSRVKVSKAKGRSIIVNGAFKDFVIKGRAKDLASTTPILPDTTTVKVAPQLAEGGTTTQMVYGVISTGQYNNLSSGARGTAEDFHQVESQPTTQPIRNHAHDPASLVVTRPSTSNRPNMSPERSTSNVSCQQSKLVTSLREDGTPAVLARVNLACKPTGTAEAVTLPEMVIAEVRKSQKTSLIVPEEVRATGDSQTCPKGQSGSAAYTRKSNVTLGPSAIVEDIIWPAAQRPETKINLITSLLRQIPETQSQGKTGERKSPTQFQSQKQRSTQTTQVNYSHFFERGKSGLVVCRRESNVTLGPSAIVEEIVWPSARMPKTRTNSITAPLRQVPENQPQGKNGKGISPTRSPNQKPSSTDTTQVFLVATTAGRKQQPNKKIQPVNEGVSKKSKNVSKHDVLVQQNNKFQESVSSRNGEVKKKQNNAASHSRALEVELLGEKEKISHGNRMLHPGLHTMSAVVRNSNSEAMDIENKGSRLDDSSSKPIAAQDRIDSELSRENEKIAHGIRMLHPGLHTMPAVVQDSNSEVLDIENMGTRLDDSGSKPIASQDRIDVVIGKDYSKRFGRSSLDLSGPLAKTRVKVHNTEQFAPDSKVEFVDVVTSMVEGDMDMGKVSVFRYRNPNPRTQVSSKDGGVFWQRSKGRWAGCNVTDVVELDALLSQCVVKLPPSAMPGDEFLVTWPTSLTGHGKDLFLFQVPESFCSDHMKNEPQNVLIFAPGCMPRPIVNGRPSRRSQRQRFDRYTHGAIPTENQAGWWKSPGKEWKNYRKSSSRVGTNYQVSSFPSSSEWNESRGKDEDIFPPG